MLQRIGRKKEFAEKQLGLTLALSYGRQRRSPTVERDCQQFWC
jgi:hypothetical protein